MKLKVPLPAGQNLLLLLVEEERVFNENEVNSLLRTPFPCSLRFERHLSQQEVTAKRKHLPFFRLDTNPRQWLDLTVVNFIYIL
jgi:hypothetical protein